MGMNKNQQEETALLEDESSFKGTAISFADSAKVLQNIDNLGRDHLYFEVLPFMKYLAAATMASTARMASGHQVISGGFVMPTVSRA